MKKRNEKENIFFIFLYISILFLIFFLAFANKNKINIKDFSESSSLFNIVNINNQKNNAIRKKIFLENIKGLKEEGCILAGVGFNDEKCDLKSYKNKSCLEDEFIFKINPKCLKYQRNNIKKPEKLRAIYYSAYAASRESKIKELISLAKKTEVNAVILDIKEINGQVYYKIPLGNFNKIKPQWNNILRNPKELLERLHRENIYTIARIVVFKDKSLAEKRPDLAIKKTDKKTIWKDYKGRSWVDPGSREVWDYNLEIARQAYLLGFDEINIDYVRFPTDGPMKDIYYTFSQEEIEKDKKWGKAKVLDKFFYYFTKKLRDEFPDIKISADVFGQVAINEDDVSIGQVLASALLYFDTVAPMSYPSHYAWNFVPLPDGPDNHPYEIIDKTLKKATRKIDKLNLAIEKAKTNNSKILIRNNFEASLPSSEAKSVKKENLILWLQAFTCTWCRSYKPYGKTEVGAQKKAVYDNGYNSWMLWNASSRYSESLFDKTD